MADFDNSNRWSLFKNDRKQTDKHPDYKGSINVGGVDYWLDGWLKTSTKDGTKFFSGTVKRKDDQAGAKVAEKPKAEPSDSYQDDIPF